MTVGQYRSGRAGAPRSDRLCANYPQTVTSVPRLVPGQPPASHPLGHPELAVPAVPRSHTDSAGRDAAVALPSSQALCRYMCHPC